MNILEELRRKKKLKIELQEVYKEVVELENNLINAINIDNQEEACRLEITLKYRLETLETLMANLRFLCKNAPKFFQTKLYQ